VKDDQSGGAEREKSDNRDAAGSWGKPQNRAAEGEGRNAPPAAEAGHAEHSIFDGAGNEIVVVTTTDEEGRVRQGTGPTSEAALEDAEKLDTQIGSGFGTQHYEE
jgi:hypothetical protein